VAAAIVAGIVVGAGLYPVAVLVGQVLTCEEGGLETIGPCIFAALASLVVSFLALSVVVAVGLRLAKVPRAFAVAGLALLTNVFVTYHVFQLSSDLQQVLGAAFAWTGVALFPIVYVAWLLVLTTAGDGERRIGVAAGMLLLVLVVAVPSTTKGLDSRRFQAEQLRWLASLQFTVFEPSSPPPDYWLSALEGLHDRQPGLQLLYRTDGPVVTITQSPPYREFSPPEGCGTGFPGQEPPEHPCEPIAAMPGGEPIFSWFPGFSTDRLYGVRLGDTVITAGNSQGRLGGQPVDPAIVRTLQSLRPVDPVELGERFYEAQEERAAHRG
jgi:hypothetical protein